MKICIKKYKNRDNNVCQITYGNNDTIRLIKTSELYDLTTGINHWLELKNQSRLDLNVDHEYHLVTDSDEEYETLSHLIKAGLNKKIIPLPEALSITVNKNPVVYSHRNIKPYEHYWKKTANKSELFKILSQDIIEIPYADDAEEYLSFHPQLAFHPNHGTTHGLRSAIIIRFLHDYLKQFANQPIRELVNQMSEEEVACLELAGLLFRSGRTNELGWTSDPTYSPRSAALFKHVALELGYDPLLVEKISMSFDFDLIIDMGPPFLGKTQAESHNMAILYQKLLHITHTCELGRCSSSKKELLDEIQTELKNLLNTELVESSEKILDFSRRLCLKTGSGIAYAEFISHEFKPNNFLTIKCSNQVEETYNELQSLAVSEMELLINPSKRHLMQSPSQLSNNSLDSLEGRLRSLSVVATKYQPPTQLWFTSGRHTIQHDGKMTILGHQKIHTSDDSSGPDNHDIQFMTFEPKDPWTEEQIQTVPTEAYREKENQFLETHISVCHATKKSNYALDLFCQALSEDHSRNRAWIRTSKLYQNRQDLTILSIDEIKKQFDEASRVDNTRYFSWHLLSCSPSLWQNADYDSQESTVDYFFGDSSVTHHDFGALITEALDNHHLLIGESEQRKELIQKFNLLINDGQYGEQGVIYQYLIPHHLVNNLAYISKTNGQPDKENQNALQTLIHLKTPDTLVPNHDTLQVRLLVPQLLDDDICRELVVVTHTNINPLLIHQLKQAIVELANFAQKKQVTQHALITKPTRVQEYTFSFFKKPVNQPIEPKKPIKMGENLEQESPKDKKIDVFNEEWWDSLNLDNLDEESDTDEIKNKPSKPNAP